MIQVENVSKRYGKNFALDNLSFTVEKGEILGFLGPNGAGKSTTMNIITGYISASEGNVKVDGIDILEQPQEAKKKIGYLPEMPPLYVEMTVREYLQFACKLKKVSSDVQSDTIESVMDVVKVKDVENRLIKNLSKGYKQRVGLAQAIIGNPDVLILDEPTVGLDPKQIIEIRNLIKDLGKKHTIILSSHILSEVSAVCDRVLIINKGKIVADGAPDELSKKFSYSNSILLRVKGSPEEVLKKIKGIPDVDKAEIQGEREPNTVDLIIEGKVDTDIREAIFTKMSESSLPILIMKPMDLTLEEIFLQVTAQEKEEDADVSHI